MSYATYKISQYFSTPSTSFTVLKYFNWFEFNISQDEYEPVKTIAEVVQEMPKTLTREASNSVENLLDFYLHSPQFDSLFFSG